MNDPVNHPNHYAGPIVKIECIDIKRHLKSNFADAFKYVWRHGEKDKSQTIMDLEKAIWYLTDAENHNQKQDSNEAMAVFSLIPSNDYDMRYRALRGIIHNHTSTLAIIRNMITALERKESDGKA